VRRNVAISPDLPRLKPDRAIVLGPDDFVGRDSAEGEGTGFTLAGANLDGEVFVYAIADASAVSGCAEARAEAATAFDAPPNVERVAVRIDGTLTQNASTLCGLGGATTKTLLQV
jgi:hypothetical protein